MTGPSTLANYIVPTIRKAAKDSGKPQPRVAAGLPVIVTKDPEAWRKRYDQTLSLYSQLPTYQETLRKEGLTRPTDVAIAGEASFVKEQLARIREAGVDDLLVHWAGPLADYRDTIELLAAENK
jgi:alkanesulfonate monooxygenase SsuD/methylene tetrahydromethanopterin reductase-like flavin-dependent oxidoreductase (luciferase family)